MKTKRLFAVIMALCLTFVMVPAQVFAESRDASAPYGRLNVQDASNINKASIRKIELTWEDE